MIYQKLHKFRVRCRNKHILLQINHAPRVGFTRVPYRKAAAGNAFIVKAFANQYFKSDFARGLMSLLQLGEVSLNS